MLKKATKKHDVIVETKKTNNTCSTSCKCSWHIILIVLLVLNLIVGIAALLKTNSPWDIETMKVGGKENMNMVKQLYNTDIYKAQQKATIEQVLQQFQQGAQWQVALPTDTTTLAQ